jgi:multidrug efflux system membrane fusion protein
MRFELFLRCCVVIVLALVFALILTACGRPEPEGQPPGPSVSTTTVAESRLELSNDLPGRVVALRSAEIRSQVSGIVQRRLFEQGSEVRAGQPLFQINAAPFRADVDTAAATLQRAQAVLARAALQAERLQPLVDADAISRQTYDDAVTQRDQAAADVAQARAVLARRRLDLEFATVDAPISGRIEQALVGEGALVSSGDSAPMARIAQIDQVYVDVRLPAASLEVMRELKTKRQAGSDGGLMVAVLRADGEPYDGKGRILFSGVNVDAGTGDVLLRVLVDNPQRFLLPGMFVRVRVPMASYADALSVPQQAVVRVGGQARVWSIDASNHALLEAVELGELVGQRYRIKAGLSVGQRVAVEGMERLSDGAKVVAQDWREPQASDAASLR